MDEQKNWYLLKDKEKDTFGPCSLDQLKVWAYNAQLSPMDRISQDQQTWMRAPMLPDLEMDWLIRVSEDQYYGPTSIGSINEFLEAGEIDTSTQLINCETGEEVYIGEMNLEVISAPSGEGDAEEAPQRTAIGISPEEKIEVLEAALREERKSLRQLQDRYNKLLRVHQEMTGASPEDNL